MTHTQACPKEAKFVESKCESAANETSTAIAIGWSLMLISRAPPKSMEGKSEILLSGPNAMKGSDSIQFLQALQAFAQTNGCAPEHSPDRVINGLVLLEPLRLY